MNFPKFKNLIFLVGLTLITILFLYLIKPFFYPIFWAATIAGIFYPVFKKINSKIKSPNLSSLATILLVLVIIIIPIVLLSDLILKESSSLYTSLSNNRGPIVYTVKNIIGWVKVNPITQKLNIDEQQITDKLSEIAKTVTNFGFTTAKNITQNSLVFLVMFILMLYALFFFLKDGGRMLKRLSRISPLSDERELVLYKKFTSTARAVLKGSLVVAFIQGSLGGMLFYVVGIENALVWGVIMGMLSVLPVFGSYIIWLPAALIMFALGNVWQGILIVLIGAIVIPGTDNIIRPILVGKDTQMHPLLILLSTLGGLVLFGISGFIIGPIITALLLSLWEMYELYYQKELSNE